MRIDQSGNGGDAVGIDDLLRRLSQTFADRLHDAVANKNRIRLPQRALELARNESADISYE